MNVLFNAEAKQWELKTQGKLTEILEKDYTNTNDTPYKLGLVELKYPDGSEETVTGSLWGASLEAHPDKFKVGDMVGLAINVDPNSEYQGNCKIELPGGRVDTARLMKGIRLPEGFGSAKGVAKKVTETT